MVDRINPFGSMDLLETAREEFVRRNAGAATQRFLRVDPFTLLAAIELDDKETAAEVFRLRATGLMLSRSVPALALGALTACVEIFTGSTPLFAGLSGLVLALIAAGCLRQSATFRKWAIIRTFETLYWNDGIEGKLSGEKFSTRIETEH